MADTEQHYWQEAAADHRSTYEGFISKVKYSIISGVIIVAILLFLGS